LQIARINSDSGVTIGEISEAEGMTTHNAAKLLRILRKAGFLKSMRGHTGGYVLARPADQIRISDVLSALGGRLFDEEYCEKFSGDLNICTHSVDCTMRSLWTSLQNAVDNVLENLTLKDLIKNTEQDLSERLYAIGENESI